MSVSPFPPKFTTSSFKICFNFAKIVIFAFEYLSTYLVEYAGIHIKSKVLRLPLYNFLLDRDEKLRMR